MTPRLALLLTSVLALALIAWAPRLALSPGPVSPGHEKIADRCLACHSLMRGVPQEKCIACHAVDRIVAKRAKGGLPVSFHQSLESRDCGDCHVEHARERTALVFSHEALPADLRGDCVSCHRVTRPVDVLHEQAGEACQSCHATETWKGARVDHERLAGKVACAKCHPVHPADGLHAGADADCATCHGTKAWKPATFEHSKYFVLDRDHAAPCLTCHPTAGEYRTWTCYGCHEHTAANIAGEHREEGIANFDNCIRCHRSADEHEGEGRRGRGNEGRRRGGGEREDDD